MAHRQKIAAVFAALVVSSGCGGDDDAGTESTADISVTTQGGANHTADCPEPPFMLELHAAQGDEPVIDEPDFAVVDTVAVDVGEGAALTLYAGDYEFDPADFAVFTTPTAPAGKTLLTIAITTFNATDTPEPIRAGEEVPASAGPDDFGTRTVTVIVDRGGSLYNQAHQASGTLTVVDVSDDQVCVAIDYRDDLFGAEDGSLGKALRGAFTADVVPFG